MQSAAIRTLSLLLLVLVTTACVSTAAPPAKHRAVLEATAGGIERWDGILRNVENLRKALGPAQTEIEVVVHGEALGMLMLSNDAQRSRIEELSREGVIFAACENAMRRMNVTRAQLFPFAKTVDAAVAEIVRKQEAGWAYVRTPS